MATHPVEEPQLTLYLVFTLLSIAISTVTYCLYQHGLDLADQDHARYIKFYHNAGTMYQEPEHQH
jgi:hypothetical protein